MKKAKIELVAPFFWYRIPGNFDWSVALDELVSLDGKISIKTIGNRMASLLISRLSKPEDHADYFNKFKPKTHQSTHTEYFVFSIYIEYEPREAKSHFGSSDISNENACYLYECFAESDLVKNVIDIALAANIAIPGSFRATEFHTFIDSEYKNFLRKDDTTFYLTHTGVGFEELHEIAPYTTSDDQWPPISKLNLIEIYNWLKNIEGFEYGAAKTPLGIAYAAFSYLMGDLGENSRSSLIWSLMGLEALYCKGNANLRQQLVEKTAVFLGGKKTHKKGFGAMYDYRSRLIHGDINIVFRHHTRDGSQEQETFDSEFFKAEKLSLAVLISTFQRMCINNLYGLSFEYILMTR